MLFPSFTQTDEAAGIWGAFEGILWDIFGGRGEVL